MGSNVLPFHIRIFDLQSSMNLEVSASDMLVGGNYFGDSNMKCYIPIFRSPHPSSTNWYYGSAFFKKYYIIFD